MQADSTIHVSTREGYDRWSALYDEDDNPLIMLDEPVVAQKLGDVLGLAVLDLGCGTGRHAARLERAGAVVTAIDFSEGMLAKARAKGLRRTRFVAGDLHRALPFGDGAFDRVICCLVCDHISDLRHVCSEMRRVCRVDGFILVTTLHPAIMLAGVQARFTDPTSGCKVYLASERHQVSDYVNAAVGSDLHIASMSEHFIDEELIARCPRVGEYRGWPLLLTMKLVASR